MQRDKSKHRICMLISLCCFLIIPFHALAEELTAGELASWCKSTDPQVKNSCRFYILGVSQGMSLGADWLKENGKKICVPDDTTQDDMVNEYQYWTKKDFKAFPEDSKMPSVGMLGAVLAQQYPCKK